MKLYLAAAFQRQLEMNEYRQRLIAADHEVTSRWNEPEQRHRGLATMDGAIHDDVIRWASDDFNDLQAAEAVVNFTGSGPTATGGRHVEFGMALAFEKHIYLVGPRENVFHYLLAANHFDDAEDFMRYLGA